VISALTESYRIFSPGEVMPTGDVAALATRAFASAFKIGMQLSAPFLVFGLVFNMGLGILARLMPAMQVYFVGTPLAILIGLVLGATAKVTISALTVAGSIIAQQLGLGFVTAVDPTQGQQGIVVGNLLTILGITFLFATDMHHLVIAALTDSYKIFKPGELISSGDAASLATKSFALAFKIGVQLSAPFLVFGLVFNIGLGVLARLMPAMQVYFVGVPLSIMIGFLIFALVLTGMMATYLNYFVGVMHELTPLK